MYAGSLIKNPNDSTYLTYLYFYICLLYVNNSSVNIFFKRANLFLVKMQYKLNINRKGKVKWKGGIVVGGREIISFNIPTKFEFYTC